MLSNKQEDMDKYGTCGKEGEKTAVRAEAPFFWGAISCLFFLLFLQVLTS